MISNKHWRLGRIKNNQVWKPGCLEDPMLAPILPSLYYSPLASFNIPSKRARVMFTHICNPYNYELHAVDTWNSVCELILYIGTTNCSVKLKMANIYQLLKFRLFILKGLKSRLLVQTVYSQCRGVVYSRRHVIYIS